MLTIIRIKISHILEIDIIWQKTTLLFTPTQHVKVADISLVTFMPQTQFNVKAKSTKKLVLL